MIFESIQPNHTSSALLAAELPTGLLLIQILSVRKEIFGAGPAGGFWRVSFSPGAGGMGERNKSTLCFHQNIGYSSLFFALTGIWLLDAVMLPKWFLPFPCFTYSVS